MNVGLGAQAAISSWRVDGQVIASERAAILQVVAGHPVVLAGAGEVLHELSEVAAMELGSALARGTDESDREPLTDEGSGSCRWKMPGLRHHQPEDRMGLRIGRAIERRASVLALAMAAGVAGFTAESIALAKPQSPREGTIAYPVDPGEPSRAGRTMIRLAYQSEGGPKSGLEPAAARHAPGFAEQARRQGPGQRGGRPGRSVAAGLHPGQPVRSDGGPGNPPDGAGRDGRIPGARAAEHPGRHPPARFRRGGRPREGDDRPRGCKTLGTDRGDAARGDEPAANEPISLSSLWPNERPFLNYHLEATTDPRGRFVFDRVAPPATPPR